MRHLSSQAKEFARYSVILPGVFLSAFPFFWRFLGESGALIAICVCCIVSSRHARSIKEKYAEEVRPDDYVFREYAFWIAKIQFAVMTIVYLAGAALFQNIVLWVYSAGILLLAVIFLIHEKLDLNERKAKEPIQRATDNDRAAPRRV